MTSLRGREQRSPATQVHRIILSLKDANHTVPKISKRLLDGSSLYSDYQW